MAPGVDYLPARFECVGDDVPQIDRLAAQRDLTGRQPRHVEEVVDQPDQVLDLPLHGLAHLTRDLDVVVRQCLHGEGVADWRERISQFVRQHGQELVLAVIGLAQGLFGPPPVVHVDDGSVPPGDRAARIALRQRAGQLPAVGAVHAAQPILSLERPLGLAGKIPQPQLARYVIRVHVGHVPVTEQRLDRRAAILGCAGRQIVEAAVGRRAPQQRRRGFAQETNLLLALAQLRLDAAALELGSCPAGDEAEDRARVLARRVDGPIVHDDEQALRLSIGGSKRDTCVAVDPHVREHAIKGEPAGNTRRIKAGGPCQYFGARRVCEVVLDVCRGSAIGPTGDHLHVARFVGVELAEIHPSHRQDIGQSPHEAAKICLARAVRPVRQTEQGLACPLLLERHSRYLEQNPNTGDIAPHVGSRAAAARRRSIRPSSVRSGSGAASGGVHSTDEPAAISRRATPT